ncbi:hypothetical protein [Bradyrhizobium sp. AUGA SZCCT0182]|uniref:hypothetical protein n=1 Tax=Bradyrhizobium sp. AUGA SZCCT0182 TaxID=2807667 RepID=UPI001BAB9285|nr:hypothetical protein [Bradyrhizobium sp. AUGA SZCCT0182]MBR1234597.1 hypothetical protein [Bradyrhizobium sp. AUGA SZCCT0182]
MSKRTFSYDSEARRRATKRRVAVYTLDECLLKAKRGDKAPLARHLREGCTIVEQRHLDALADLISAPKRGKGRPRGHDPSERAQALRIIVGMVRRLERDWLAKNPNKAFRGRRKKIAEALAMIGDDDFSFADPITEAEIYAALNSGGSSQKNRN